MRAMGKNKGFNAPFAQLSKALPKAREAAPPPTPAPVRAINTDLTSAPRSDEELFLAAMRGAKPLEGGAERLLAPPPEVSRRLNDEAMALAELQDLVDGRAEFRVTESEEVYTGAAPGVNQQLMHRLQEGHFAFQRHLDLHGLDRDSAHVEVNRFISAARRDGERCVLIITGRGRKSPGGMAVLRESLPRWLSRSPLRPHVLAFCNARAVDGGPGAFYVLLRRAGVKPFGTPS
jgi:DNA-nicking Smr family endonuclease